ncbi:MAG: hypothetical protein ACO3MF_04535 [Acholeplasmataceae bacterium]
MIIYVDIDNTICTTIGSDYENAQARLKEISKINALYDAGHTIIYYTARGTITHKCWRSLTEKQLMSWGAKYNDLKFGKPAYDLLIDDKAINSIGDLDNEYQISDFS